jgi:WD40 repeat protein
MSSVVLATAGYDHTIRFWEATSGICYRTLQYADSQVNKLEITAEKQYVAAAGNSQVRLFEVNSNDPQPVMSYDGHAGNVTAVGFQKDSKWMYTGARDGVGRGGVWGGGGRGLHAAVQVLCVCPPACCCAPLVGSSSPHLHMTPTTHTQ